MPYGVYPRTEEHKAKMFEVLKPTMFPKGNVPWNKGISWIRGKNSKPRSEEWRKKQSLSHMGQPSWNKGIRGEKSHTWKGGISGLTSAIRRSDIYKQWRADVYRRDGWTCQTCGLRGHGKDIHAHHIIPMVEILKKVNIKGISFEDKYSLAMSLPELFDVSNGVTLCRNCHTLTFKKTRRKK